MLVTQEALKVRIDSIPTEVLDVQKDADKIGAAATIGYEQMGRFFQESYILEHPQVWIGGRDGGIREPGRTASVHAYDLAQTYGAIRNRLLNSIQTNQTVEVRRSQNDVHLPSYEYIKPDLFDLVAIEATLQGALSACADNPRSREVDRARLHIQKLLSGEVFQRGQTGDYLQSTAVNRPNEDDLIGAVIVLWTVFDGQPRILVQQETMSKPHFDKEPGDMSLLAEGRRPFESIRKLLRRMTFEEIGWRTNTMSINKEPIGYYHFPDHKNLPGGGWIAAVEAQVDPFIALTQPVGSQDGETINHMWVSPNEFFEKFPVRGAMTGIIDNWLRGDRDIVSTTSPGRHAMQIIFKQGRNGSSGSISIQPRI